MPSLAMNSHEHFEELAALDFVGELSLDERKELQSHLKFCELCQQEYKAYHDIHSNQLPLLHSERLKLEEPVLVDFAVVATIAGQNLNEAKRIPNLLNIAQQAHRDHSRKSPLMRLPQLAYGLCAILLFALGILAFEKRQQSGEARTQITALQTRASSLNRELQTSAVTLAKSSVPAKGALTRQQDHSVRSAMRIRDLEQQLRTSADASANLKEQVQASQRSNIELGQRLAEAERERQELSAELQNVSRDRDETSANLKGRETELQDRKTELQDKKAELLGLEQEAEALREEVDRDRSLLAASHDITNLMGARNLRIIDVSDIDGKGKTRKAFGRVFFTEGKSLVFYAFDLPDMKSSTRPASFQAWGAQGSNVPAARSLGIFFHDDHNTNRWVLKFNDPEVLSEIDSVFVTVEPLGGSRKPTGTPLLPAYLKAELNHP